jgi:16S rRNA pseudouridine516 synthase
VSRVPSARTDRLLANLGYGSRRDIQAMVRRGRVTLDGTPLKNGDIHLPLTEDLPDRLSIDGQRLDPLWPLTLVMHKPLGVVCSHRESGRSIYELLPTRWRSREPPLSTIGRLDAETTGLLLFTDDGGLLHRVISPRAKVAKRYLATLARPLRGDEGEIFAAGTLQLEGDREPLAPAALEPLSATSAWLTITEGRYHQVRRMFAAVGNHVEALHRDRIGALDIPETLAPGEWRIAGPKDLAQLLDAG